MAKVKIDFVGDTSQLKKSVSDVKSQIDGLNRSGTSGGINLSNVLGIGAAITGIMALKNAMVGLGGVIGDASKKAASFETLAVQLKVLTQSAAEAKRLVAEISKYGAETPFKQEPIQQSVKTLLGFGIAAKDVMNVVKLLGDASGGEDDKLLRLATIFGKVSSANKMMADDLNQLIDAGFNPAQEMTEKMGISVSELRDRMSDGKIGIAELRDALITATSAGGRYNGMLKQMSNTTEGKLSNLADTIDQLKIAFGTGFNTGLKDVLDQADTISKEFKSTFENLGKASGELLSVLAKHLPQLTADIKKALESGSIFGAMKAGIVNVLEDQNVKAAVAKLGELLIPESLRQSGIVQTAGTLSRGTDATTGALGVAGLVAPGVAGVALKGAALAGIGLSSGMNSEESGPSTSDTLFTMGGLLTLGIALKNVASMMQMNRVRALLGTLRAGGSSGGVIGLAGAAGYGFGSWVGNKYAPQMYDYFNPNQTEGGPLSTGYNIKTLQEAISKLAKPIDTLNKESQLSRENMQKLVKEAEVSALDSDIKELSRLAYETLSLQEKAPKFPISQVIEQDPLEAFFANPTKGKPPSKPLDLFKPFINSMQAMGGGKIFGGVDPVSIARDSLNQLKIIARNTSRTYAVAG